jgi:phosphohistidine phosphatase
MKTLILMRHAKSSWADPGAGDHDRSLNKRGRAAAPVMALWLQEHGLRPDVVLCSSARRTRETAALMREAVPSLPEPEVSDALYHASPRALRAHLTRLPADCGCALLIAHEPGLGLFLRMLGGDDAPSGLLHAYGHYPTSAMAILKADIADWARLAPDTTEFTDFVMPRELMGKLMENPSSRK